MLTVKIDGAIGEVKSVIVSGHALYDDYGKDIVCSAISAIVFGTLNAIDMLAPTSCSVEVDYVKAIVKIIVIDDNCKAQDILETMIIQLKSIAEDYTSNIKISRKE